MSETQRRQLLDEAVTAVAALLAYWGAEEELVEPTKPGADHRPVLGHLEATAASAVTRAVVRGDHIHTLISARLARRDVGLIVAGLIGDPDERARAWARERHAAERYAAYVRETMRAPAVARAQGGGDGAKTETAKLFGITRKTLDAWLAQSAEEDSVA